MMTSDTPTHLGDNDKVPSSDEISPFDLVSCPADILVDVLKLGIKRIPGPQHVGALFEFTHAIRAFLNRDINTAWLLQPTNDVPKEYRGLRARCGLLIKARVTSSVFRPGAWPHDVRDILDYLDEKTPDPSAYGFSPSYKFPDRLGTESMATYLDRLELWVDAHLPMARKDPDVASRVCRWAWAAQRSAFCTIDYDEKFLEKLPQFKTLDQFMSWIMIQPKLLEAVASQPAKPQRHSSQPSGASDQGNKTKPDKSDKSDTPSRKPNTSHTKKWNEGGGKDQDKSRSHQMASCDPREMTFIVE